MDRMPPTPGTIYHGDCLEVMRGWPDKCVDAVITDPPYGVGLAYHTYDDSFKNWTDLMTYLVPELKRICKGIIVFPSGGHKNTEWLWKHYPPRWTICWYKGSPGCAAAIGFNDWEVLFVYGDDVHRNAHDHFYAKPSDGDVPEHPCAKSLDYYRWQIAKLTREDDVILEPFAGSGGGLVVAEQAGRKWVGIEMDHKYVKLCRDRVAAETAQGKLF